MTLNEQDSLAVYMRNYELCETLQDRIARASIAEQRGQSETELLLAANATLTELSNLVSNRLLEICKPQ